MSKWNHANLVPVRSKRPDAGEALIALLDDRVLSGHAVKARRQLKVPATRAGLERMLRDEHPWVRTEAQRAFAAIGGSPGPDEE